MSIANELSGDIAAAILTAKTDSAEHRNESQGDRVERSFHTSGTNRKVPDSFVHNLVPDRSF